MARALIYAVLSAVVVIKFILYPMLMASYYDKDKIKEADSK